MSSSRLDEARVVLPNVERNRVPHILMIDSFSSDNSGDAAILTTMMDSLREVLVDVEFKVHSSHPSVTQGVHRVDASYPLFMSNPFRSGNARFHQRRNDLQRAPLVGKWMGSAACWLSRMGTTLMVLARFVLVCLLAVPYRLGQDVSTWPLVNRWESFVDYCRADAIWGMGGTFYNDNYRLSLRGRLLNLLSGRILNKVVCISSHSFGPFNRWDSRCTARFVLNHLDLICCRSQHDVDVLRNLGVAAPRTEVTADTAWLLHPTSRARAQEILDEEGLAHMEGDFHVSLSAIRSWLHTDTDSAAAHRRYVESLVEVIDRLVVSEDASVLFVSTSAGGTTRDDRLVAEEIRLRVKHPDRFLVLREAYRAEELKAIYGVMDLHIGTRMHSNILALSMGVPVVAIAYEAKSMALMESLGLSEYVLDIEDIRAEDLWHMTTRVIENSAQLHRHLLDRLPETKRRARLNAYCLAQLLRE